MNESHNSAFNIRCYENSNASADAPRFAVETDPTIEAVSGSRGVAFHVADGGDAKSGFKGVAVCGRDGASESTAQGVAVANDGGNATTGDGGVSIAKGALATASCESWGVAFLRSDSLETLGKVRGREDSVLILSWADGNDTQVRSAQVGTQNCVCVPRDSSEPCCKCTLIEPGVWYTIDRENSFQWIQVDE
jgi:hypothetical protein